MCYNSMKLEMDRIKIIQLAIAIFLLLFINFISGGLLKNIVGYIGEPLVIWGYQSGNSVNTFFSAMKGFNNISDELIVTKADLAKLEADKATYQLLDEENKQLKAQIGISDPTKKIVEAQILTSALYQNDRLILNVGKNSGLCKGSIALTGNYYIGLVNEEPLSQTSEVILASNSQSFLQVMIIPEKSVEDLKKETTDLTKFSKGVMSGSVNGATIENIPLASKVEIGDFVIVNDVKVGRYLYVGKIEKIEGKESDTTRKALVDPFLNYDDLKYIFVEIKC